MRHILEARNLALVQELGKLTPALASSNLPPELVPYRERILIVCDELRREVQRNLADISLGREEILEDVLSNTQKVMQYMRLLSACLVVPILRASSADRLGLTTIGWVHRQHQKTAAIPPAFADGECAIFPFVDIVPIYFFPCLEQRSLLYQSLYFHEFGHLLYRRHKQEMDDLVRELQQEVEDVLIPLSQRSDRHAKIQATRRQAIVDTWYRWAQELFCDAIGLTIGGPSFLWAFSRYLGTMGRGDFYREPGDLDQSEHPVTWLRVQFLCKRARANGFAEAAAQVEDEWRIMAQTIGAEEDYHGFYDQTLEGAVNRTINDMLTEAEPRRCTESEGKGIGWDVSSEPLVPILNHAWEVYRADLRSYTDWEAACLRRLLV